ncbi:MAG: hypothetical protein IJB20_00265, partial [Clostridia bacterium]|nr:hypothetical protein [Clostridia bacterium]
MKKVSSPNPIFKNFQTNRTDKVPQRPGIPDRQCSRQNSGTSDLHLLRYLSSFKVFWKGFGETFLQKGFP